MPDKPAQTAYGVMIQIAMEQYLPESHRIVDDRLAYRMLPASMRLLTSVMGFRPIRRWMFKTFENMAPGIRNSILSRKRYIDDRLLESLNAGIDTVMILGAGLDTRSYRLPQLSAVRVYEVDLPQNIAYKRKKLQEFYGSVPGHVVLVPIDFEHQDLDPVLSEYGYPTAQKSFFIWEGVTQYLTEAGVRNTFQLLAKAQPGSRLVFTYVLKSFVDGSQIEGLENWYRRVRVKSQLWLLGFDPDQIVSFIGEYGWHVSEHVGAREYLERYVKPASRTEPVSEIERAVYAEKAAHYPNSVLSQRFRKMTRSAF